MEISPVSRNRPSSVDSALTLTDAVVAPSPNWTTGERWISEIRYTYPRYFLPRETSGFQVASDGLATRKIDVIFEDAESQQRYGAHPEEFDCAAFAAVGTVDGLVISGQLEQASLLAQTGKFELLERYRAGVQSIPLTVRRNHIPNVRVGDWLPWVLQWLPDRSFGLRGSESVAAQVVSIRDDNCVWRSLVLEESALSAGPPGRVVEVVRYDDQPSAGEFSFVVFSDVESY
jgi:hypothetical protein